MVGLLLAQVLPEVEVTALEMQPELASLARRNAALNNLSARLQVALADMRLTEDLPGQAYDTVVINPPFRPKGSGRLGPGEQRNQARHELTCNLDQWTRAAAHALKPKGRLYLVFPAWRLVGLMAGLKGAGLTPKRLRMVYSRPGGPGRLVLIEARPGGGEELTVASPLYIHHLGQNWSEETAALVRDLSPV